MAKPQPNYQQSTKTQDKKSKDYHPTAPEHKEPELKGTFASVMLLGAFLVITWVGAYLLFISRM